MADAAAPATMGLREFAEHLGCKPGYVTELKRDGRLVLTEDGKRVQVAESLRLIADTRDPSKQGVRDRHAAARKSAPGSSPSPNPLEGAPGQGPALEDAGSNDPHARRRAKALADKEEVLLRKALREEQVDLGQLLVAEDVKGALVDAVTILRSRLELLVPTLAPQIAALDDEDRVRVLMRDGIEQVLSELSRKFAQIGRADA